MFINIKLLINGVKKSRIEGYVVAGRGLQCKLNEVILNSGPFKVCTRKVELPAKLGSPSESRQQDVVRIAKFYVSLVHYLLAK